MLLALRVRVVVCRYRREYLVGWSVAACRFIERLPCQQVRSMQEVDTVAKVMRSERDRFQRYFDHAPK